MAADDLVRIPISAPLGVFGYAAYATLPASDVNLPLIGAAWAIEHCGDPLRSMLERYMGDGRVKTMVAPRSAVGDPPLAMLRAMRIGEEEERRFRAATQVVLIRAPFDASPPPLHVLAPLAVANGVAATFGGVVLDPLVPRLLPVATQTEPLPASGAVAIVKHIACPMSQEADGTAWMTTAGMPKFGLANFEMRFLPPNLAEVVPIMNAVAHRCLHEQWSQAQKRRGREALDMLTLPAELRITHADLVRAFGTGTDRGGSTTVRLTWNGRRRADMEPFVEIGPPRAFGGQHRDWYPLMLQEFLG